MPTRNNAVRLLIGDLIHDDWESYEVDSDLLIPADAWRVTLSLRDGQLPDAVIPGASVKVLVGDDPVMVGRIDEVSADIAKDGARFNISGRDGAAVLLDCSSPIFTVRMVSLAEVVAKVVRPLGVTVQEIKGASRRREKINVEPGETAWETLTNAAEANGLWPWFEPDGTLVVGGPDYDQAPVAKLVLRTNGRDNNVLHLARRVSIQGRYSHVTVLGQKHGTDIEQGKHALQATEVDDGVRWYRPKVIVDYEAESEAVCRSRAKKLLLDSRLKGFSLFAQVVGHRIVAPGQPTDGLLWKPGQRVHVISERHGIDAVFFLMARKFTGGRQQASRTQLELKEDRTWVLEAHPHKKNHRLGKNAAPLEVRDLSKGSWQAAVDKYYKDKVK